MFGSDFPFLFAADAACFLPAAALDGVAGLDPAGFAPPDVLGPETKVGFVPSLAFFFGGNAFEFAAIAAFNPAGSFEA